MSLLKCWTNAVNLYDIKLLISSENWVKYNRYINALHSKALRDLYRELREIQQNKHSNLIDINEEFIYEINSGAYDDVGSYDQNYMKSLRTFN